MDRPLDSRNFSEGYKTVIPFPKDQIWIHFNWLHRKSFTESSSSTPSEVPSILMHSHSHSAPLPIWIGGVLTIVVAKCQWSENNNQSRVFPFHPLHLQMRCLSIPPLHLLLHFLIASALLPNNWRMFFRTISASSYNLSSVVRQRCLPQPPSKMFSVRKKFANSILPRAIVFGHSRSCTPSGAKSSFNSAPEKSIFNEKNRTGNYVGSSANRFLVPANETTSTKNQNRLNT